MKDNYDVIIVGGGHAGCEAAASASKLGCSVLLITMSINGIAQMSCNPAMGGVAKGQIVREIDALGGYSGIVSDATSLQFRMLNTSKGAAVWSPRTQNDCLLFGETWKAHLESIENLYLFQDAVNELIIKNKTIIGVKTQLGLSFYSKKVIITAGTFLNGLIHIGEKAYTGGRIGEKASKGITEQLVELGFESGRMKTGTPPRVDGKSLDFSEMEEQKGDTNRKGFSFLPNTLNNKPQLSCYISHTSTKVHEELKKGFDKSPMFNGRIKSIGPRYCPSIEDKINRFSSKESHQLFIEPMGWNTNEIYVNGFSTSLPFEIQEKALRLVPGFRDVHFFRYGYAVEYDYFPPTQINHTLETKLIKGLYFAGQINGTTGYEEAACQGLVAGINAVNSIFEKPEFTPKRNEAYIGVLIDDLVTKGTEEPYRMFTSRSEFRTLLRQDNADIRLTKIGHELGLASKKRLENLIKKEKEIEKTLNFLKKQSVSPNKINSILEKNQENKVKHGCKLIKILSRPNIDINKLCEVSVLNQFLQENKISDEAVEQVEINTKYESYILKEKEFAEKLDDLQRVKIPKGFDYTQLYSISSEAVEKLSNVNPKDLSQAKNISGISPNDISILMLYLSKRSTWNN